jgi:hypothetical protein
VAFEPTLDPSRASPMATPDHWGVATRLPPVHGEAMRPPPRSGVGPNLGVAFGPTIPSAGWTSIRRRSSVRWRVSTRESAACSGLGGAGSIQTHVGGALVLAWLVFRPDRWQRVHYGRWRRGLAWAVPAASGLAVAECLLGQGRSLSSQFL